MAGHDATGSGPDLPSNKVALGIEYDGSQYHGWQLQSHDPRTVQAEVEAALSRIADQPVRVICAGRTDSGVHATAQVVHFDAPCWRDKRAWIQGANSYLPRDIRVLWCHFVADDFHARFRAQSRRYLYVINNRRVRPAIMTEQLTWERRPLDAEAMHAAAQYLPGERDFSSFRASHCQALTAFRSVHHLRVKRVADLIIIDIKANAFLYHMVRNIAGVLIDIGRGDREPEWAREVLDAHDRKVAGVTAPSHGLYLVEIEYPDQYGLPNIKAPPLFLSQTCTLRDSDA